jgi:hypothetical protein
MPKRGLRNAIYAKREKLPASYKWTGATVAKLDRLQTSRACHYASFVNSGSSRMLRRQQNAIYVEEIYRQAPRERRNPKIAFALPGHFHGISKHTRARTLYAKIAWKDWSVRRVGRILEMREARMSLWLSLGITH